MLPQLKQPEYAQGFSDSYSNQEYHHGQLKDLISSTDIKLFERSPAHYREHKINPPPATPALTFGLAFHSVALGFADEVVIEPKINKRTNAGKEEYAEFCKKSAGKYVVSAAQYNTINDMVDSINRHRLARKLLNSASAQKEVTGIFKDSGTDLWCKIRPDIIDFNSHVITDLKTTLDASEDEFNRSIFKFYYHFSALWYTHGASVITGDGFTFLFVAVEKEPPYGVNVFKLPDVAYRVATERIFSMMGKFADCFREDKWPCYDQRLVEADMPGWAMRYSK